MRVDNDGEGGILALMALLGVKREKRSIIVAVGLFGAALIYGDGAITPAISVLSALEGLELVTHAVHRSGGGCHPDHVVCPQPLGTERIGRTFGPIMAFWFVAIAALGLWGIAQHPTVLAAVDPRYAVALTAFGNYLDSILPFGKLILTVLNGAVPLILISFLFAAIYKVLPDRNLEWRDVAVGAVVTGVLFTIGKSLISWYIGSSAVASSFGAAGALIVLLLWVYYSAQIFLLGAEFTEIFAEHHGSKQEVESL
jgi:K+ potassium transporter/Virulence factor BrkB